MLWVRLGSETVRPAQAGLKLFRTMPLGRASDLNTLIVYNPAHHCSNTPHEHRKATGFNPCIPPLSIFTCAVSTLSKSGVHNEGNCLKSGDFPAWITKTCTVFIEVSSHASSLSIQFSSGASVYCIGEMVTPQYTLDHSWCWILSWKHIEILTTIRVYIKFG